MEYKKEDVYLIPRSFNRDFTLIGTYTITDLVVIMLLVGAAVMVMYYTRTLIGFMPPVLLLVCRFKYDERTIFFWTSAAARFIYRKLTDKSTYFLLEKEEKPDWRC